MKTVINIIVTVVMSVMAVLGATLTASAATTTPNVVGVTVNISPSSAGATASWQIMFTPSTGSALTASASTVTLTTNATMSFPTVQSDYSVNGVPVTGGITNIQSGVIITMPVSVALYNTATITVDGVVNPGSGSYSLGVATSATANPSPSTVSFTINPGAPAICPSSAANSTMPQCVGVPPITPYDGNVNGGTWVQITGANLANATEVTFGQSNPGTNLEIISNTTIGVTSPPEAQSDCIPGAATSGTGYSCVVNIQVVTPSGTSAVVSSDEFTYTNSPNCLSVQSVSPAYGPTTSTGFSETGGSTYVPGSGYVARTGTTTVQGSVQVVISGNLFDADNLTATAVSFAPATGSAIPAPWFKVINNTTIDAVAPPNTSPQTMNVEVTVPVASSSSETSYETSPATYADQFTYYTTPPAGPTITSVTPSSGTQLGGTIVNITGTNFAQVESVSFGGVGTETFDVISPSEITAPSPAYSCGANTVGSCVVNIQVLTVNGVTQVTAADEFTYMGLPTIVGPGNTDGVNPSCGPVTGGTPVTISGNNLQGVTTVQFGTAGNATDVTYVAGSGGTEVTATSPPVSLNGAPSLTENVTVTGTMGTSPLSSTATFTYPCGQLPTVTELRPTSGFTSGGTSVTITGTNLTGATSVDFGTAPATSFTVNSSTQIVATSPPSPLASPGIGTVNVTVTTPVGTSAITTADRYTYTLQTGPCNYIDLNGISPDSELWTASGGTATISISAQSTKIPAVECIKDINEVNWGAYELTTSSATQSSSSSPSSTVQFSCTASSSPPPSSPSSTPSNEYAKGQCVVTIPTASKAGCSSSSQECQVPVSTVTTVSGYSSETSSNSRLFYYTVAGEYTPLNPPIRICDTRSVVNGTPLRDVASGVTGQCANSGVSVGINQNLIVDVGGIGTSPDNIPSNAESVIATVTVASAPAGGYLSLNPGRSTYSSSNPPNTSLVNFSAGEITSDTGTFLLNTSGELSLFSSATVPVIVDISGYYVPSSGASYSPMSPERICDTRKLASSDVTFAAQTDPISPNLCSNSGVALSGGQSGIMQITPVYGGGPISQFAGATAVSLVVGVIGTSSTQSGYITVYPASSSNNSSHSYLCGNLPATSSVNYQGVAPHSNAVVVGISGDNGFCIYNSNKNDPVNIYIDLQGYFTLSSSGVASYVPITPIRVCDTRSALSDGSPLSDVITGVTGQCANSGESVPSTGTVEARSVTINIPSSVSLPPGVSDVVANVAIVDTTAGGYATAYQTGESPTATSNLNWGSEASYPNGVIPDVSNMVTVPISSSSPSFQLYVSSGANVIVDIYGYYIASS